ncbi:MAG: toll/interleukin-1 receptor domain-containing protein [Chloroflexi bacterium]|nr:toll/interleukin-1 receptor domain-containing protein [Chloroflexota bacterium]
MANVFISHRASDAQLAERLSRELRDAGHQVWLDEWEIGLGDSIVERMNEGLQGAAYVVVCYSAAGVTSPWMSREWASALARQLEGHGVKILPVRLSDGPPPAILADLRYADLVKDWQRGVGELLRALR